MKLPAKLPALQNPGPWSFAVLAAAVVLVVAMFVFKVPEAAKFAVALGSVLTAWLSRSPAGASGDEPEQPEEDGEP